MEFCKNLIAQCFKLGSWGVDLENGPDGVVAEVMHSYIPALFQK